MFSVRKLEIRLLNGAFLDNQQPPPGMLRNFILPAKGNQMAVPKKKTSKSKRNMRRSHDSLKQQAYVEDETTGEFHRPHHVDMKTGFYKGRQVIEVKEKI